MAECKRFGYCAVEDRATQQAQCGDIALSLAGSNPAALTNSSHFMEETHPSSRFKHTNQVPRNFTEPVIIPGGRKGGYYLATPTRRVKFINNTVGVEVTGTLHTIRRCDPGGRVIVRVRRSKKERLKWRRALLATLNAKD